MILTFLLSSLLSLCFVQHLWFPCENPSVLLYSLCCCCCAMGDVGCYTRDVSRESLNMLQNYERESFITLSTLTFGLVSGSCLLSLK